METDYNALAFWWHVLLTFCTMMVGIYAWLKARQTATQDSINQVDTRVVRLEARADHSPSKSDMDDLHHRITDQGEVMRRLEGELHQMNRTLQLINEHLLNK